MSATNGTSGTAAQLAPAGKNETAEMRGADAQAARAPSVRLGANGNPVTNHRHERRAEPTREILNIEEAAELLGVSLKTFNKVLHAEDVPARKIGREWKFSRRALIQWVGNGRASEFYRDDRDDDEAEAPTGTLVPERAKSRRTAGWQIEND